MAPDGLDNRTTVPIGWVAGAIVAVIAVTGVLLGLQRAYYTDQKALDLKIEQTVNAAVAALESRYRDEDSETAETLRAIERRMTAFEVSLAVGTANRYTAVMAESVWAEAERINTVESIQQYGFRKPDIWKYAIQPINPFAAVSGSPVKKSP